MFAWARSFAAVLALAAPRRSFANSNDDTFNSEHATLLESENEFGRNGKAHHERRSRIAAADTSPASSGGLELSYFAVWREGGYCDNDLSKQPEPGPNDEMMFYGTLAECCEASFAWREDNACLSNSQKIIQTSNQDPQQETSAPLTISTKQAQKNSISTSSVYGYAFFDSNNDGVRDGSLDVGVGNISVSLFTCADEVVNTTNTDDSGYYAFEELSRGAYYIMILSLPSKYHKFSSAWNGKSDQNGELLHPGVDSAVIPETGQTTCFGLEEGEEMTVMFGIELDVPPAGTVDGSPVVTPRPTNAPSHAAPPDSTIFNQDGISEIKSSPTVSVNSTAVSVPLSVGKEGCRCIDVSFILSSFTERSCQTSEGQLGVFLTAEGQCVPHAYGSSACLRHDALHDPKCKVVASGEADMPNYCFRRWCYVDATTCRRSSAERVYRSDHFTRGGGVDVFYSYSTCGSTDEDWTQYKDQHSLDGTLITAIVPTYTVPIMYKRSPIGDILTSVGEEYYDSSVRYEGAFMDYLDNLMDVANGEFSIDYTFGSEAGRRVHPTSKYTASIQDIADGLADMAIGRFWITSQRLKLTSFTVPLYYDKTVLVIPKPDDSSSQLNTQTRKVLQPFTLAVWGLILLLILVTALLTVWFTNYGREFRQSKQKRLKKSAYARVSLDEFLQKGIFFCSAGVEQDADTSLPQKLLMFGFSFFILIVVSAYVANLAAFLTQPADFVGTIDAVNKRGLVVCAHPVLQTELQVAHPTVKFLFSEGEYEGMIQDYNEGKCNFLAVGKGDILTDVDRTSTFCDSGLVITDSLFIEIPVAFPIRPDLASGMSYWMHLGKNNHGITFQAAIDEYLQPKCKLEFSPEDQETSDYAQIHPENFFFPFIFFIGFALLAVILQLYHQRALKKGSKRTLVGRQSSLERKRSGLLRDISKRFASSRRFDVNELDDPDDDELQTSHVLDNAHAHYNTNDIEHTGCKKRVKFMGCDDNASLELEERDVFHDNDHSNNLIEENASVSPGKQSTAASRLQLLVETGAFDDILECVHDIKRQKES